MNNINNLNNQLSAMGLPTITDEATCEEREQYLSHLAEADWDNEKWLKKLKTLQQKYLVNFYKYVAIVYPYLRFEIGEDKTYWNYNVDDGVYDEMSAVTAKELVIRLLIDEDLVGNANENTAKTILARYRACFPERGNGYDEFDVDDNWFHAANGWVNVDTLAFELHTPSRISRRKSAVTYDAEAVCPVYDKFVEKDLQLKEDQVRVIDQFSGLILTSDIRYQKMLTLVGRPGCGKSTLLNTWSHVLGEMALEKKLTELSSESARFAGSQFVGSTLCWFDEVNVKKAEMSNNLGTLITGETINVERKGINGITKARNSVKCVLTANLLPMTAEIGMYRRLILINIPVSFSEEEREDKEMPDKLKAEGSGILNRMLAGLQDLRKMRGFTVIAGHADLIEEYKAQSDTIAEFLDEYFDVGTVDDFVPTKEMYKAYQHFAEGNSWTRSITPQKFGRLLKGQPLSRFAKIEPSRLSSDGSRGWSGLKLKKGYEFDAAGIIVSAFGGEF
jgi:P4 family phage/plasmid primase-like protien